MGRTAVPAAAVTTRTSRAEGRQTAMQFTVRHIPAGAASVVEESIDAGSDGMARANVAARGSVVLHVAARASAVNATTSVRFDVDWWCRELRTLLRSGMTAVEAIETLAAGQASGQRGRVVGDLLSALQQGQSLSKAMRTVGAFPAVLVAGVTASERTSTLPDALEDYLRYQELLDRLKRQAVGSAIYPAVVVSLGLVITLFLLMFVVPRFSRVYVGSPESLSTATQAVLFVSRAVEHHAAWLVAGLVAAIGAVLIGIQRGWFARVAVEAIESIAPLRAQMQHFRLAKLYQSLALMFRGGYTLDEAMAVCSDLGLGERLRQALAQTRRDIGRGKSIDEALRVAGLTDGVTGRMIAAGARSGQFDTVLGIVAERHAVAFTTFIERATRIVEPLLLLLVALVVGGIVVLMYMPIFDIATGLGPGAR
jgi:general secretion pathway protein F